MEELKSENMLPENSEKNIEKSIDINSEEIGSVETILSSEEIKRLGDEDQEQADLEIGSIAKEMEKFKNDDAVRAEREKIAKDPELNFLYHEIIEKGNFDLLREKSAEQLEELSKRYFGKFSIFKLGEHLRKKEKLKSFETFVDSLEPVRADKNNFPEFKSPKESGKVASYGPQDIIVRSEEYVYGSFDKIGHSMSKGENQHVLDEKEIVPRAQIIMNDIANVVARSSGESYAKKYLNNTFDYDSGKKILTLYLASVFDNPQQAEDVLSRAEGQAMTAQRWDSEGMLNYRDSTFADMTPGAYQQQQKREEEMMQTFLGRMKSMLKDTGIEPPLSIEIRVKDSAKVLNRE